MDDIENFDNKFLENIIISNKIDQTCNSYTFTFIVFFIQSFISLGYFYIYYIFKFKIDNKISIVIEILLFLFLFIITAFIALNIFSDNKDNIPIKLGNYTLFIIIIVNQIIFDTFLYLLISLDSYHEQIDFPHFEAKAYWKISLCLFFFFSIFYSYFKKKENLFNLYLFILFALASFLFFIILILVTQKDNKKSDRFYYLIMLAFEILLPILSIFINYNIPDKQIWKVSISNALRSGSLWLFVIVYFPLYLIFRAIIAICKICDYCCSSVDSLCDNTHCCDIIINNYK